MAFSKKVIRLVFTLGGNSPSGSSATFGGTSANQVTIDGLRVSCKIAKAASPSLNRCELQIFGLLPNVYNALASMYNVTQQVTQNTVQVFAGDSTASLSKVFEGQITLCQVDLNQQPDCLTTVIAQSAYLQRITPINPTVYPVAFDLAGAMQTLAGQMGLQFENNGVQITLPAMTLTGTGMQQVQQLQQASTVGGEKVVANVDDDTLVICPPGGNRTANVKPIPISAQTGMIGYPAFGTHGIAVRSLYNPAVKWQSQIQLTSSLKVMNLNGLWTVFGVTHTLESEMPEGKWETQIEAANFMAIGS